MDDYFVLIVGLIVILIFIVFFITGIEENFNIENYDIENAILIDNFITYSRFGSPSYYLVYKFEDNSIKEIQVLPEQYYTNIKSENEEGS